MLFLILLLIIFKEIDRCPTTVSLLQVFFFPWMMILPWFAKHAPR